MLKGSSILRASAEHSKHLRVLHVTPYFAPAWGFGGPPHSILSLCQALPSAGVDVEVFTTTADANGRELEPRPQGTVHAGVPVRYFPLNSPRALLHSRALTRTLASEALRADVIHIHGLFNATAWAGASLARRAARPVVLSARGMLQPAALAHHAARKRLAWTLFDRRLVNGASVIHCTSAAEVDTIRTLTRTPTIEIPNAVTFEPRTVSSEARTAARAVAGVPVGRRYVLFLGRLHPIKRLDLVAKAFVQLASRVDVDLVIVGDGDEDCRRAAAGLLEPVASRVHWAGGRYGAERDALLIDASALVLCSDSENFGMSVAEALAAGVPPVVTRTCPWRVLEETGAGVWVEQSAPAIAAALEYVVSDPDRARRMGEHGRALASQRFAAARVAAEWHAAYERVLQHA